MGSKVVLAGNNLAATYALDLLLEVCDRMDILAVAPEPERVAPWQASLATAAATAGVECLEPTDVNAIEIASRIRKHKPTLLLSVYYTQIFSEPVFEAVDGPMLNFHPSLLPRHRGTAPLIWAIVEGDSATGLTVHHLDRGVDTGNVLLQHVLPIHPDDTGHQLHLKMARLVGSATAEILRAWANGEAIPPGEPQTGVVSHHSSRDPEVNHLDWSSDRGRLRNIVRALAPPLPGAFAVLDGKPLIISGLDLADATGARPRPPGMVDMTQSDTPMVWAADGPLRITSFVDEGRVLAGRELGSRRGVTEGQILG